MATTPTTGYDVQGNASIDTPTNAQSIGGLSQTQASGIQDIYKANISKGMTPAESQAAIKADPSFATAKAVYQQAPVAPTAPAPFVPNAPETPQTNLEVQRNAEQATFNAANPVGTKAENVVYTAPSQIKPIASVEAPQAITTPKPIEQATTAQKTPILGVDDMATLKQNADDNRKREILGNL